ncbi:MAG: glycosyltransferase family 4 protein [bacterium]|nr:glycosyltransferase family 4 protein [bacterium]
MRITLLTPGTGHFFCGSCLRDSALAQALRERGHDAVIVPLYLPFVLEGEHTEEPEVLMGGINMYLQQKLPLLRHTPRWIAAQLDRPGLLRWASGRGNMTDASQLGEMTLSMLRGEEGRQSKELDKLIEWLRGHERPEVILLSNVMLTGLARRLKEAFDVPVACSVQGEEPFLDSLEADLRERAWETLRERAAGVDAFVPVSRWYGDRMRERLQVEPDKVHVVHNGIDVADFMDVARADGDPEPTIGFLARMCAEKGLPTLVDAFIRLRERGQIRARLAVCGVVLDPDRKLVEELSAKLDAAGLAGAYEFLPNVDRPRKLDFLRSLDVLSVPATYGESFGLYLLEALAAGVPVVQPRHGAFPEVLAATGGGRLCEPDDPESLAVELEQLLSEPGAARALGAAGRKTVLERFTIQRMARDIEAVCKRVTTQAATA